jgi:hypothetical protein
VRRSRSSPSSRRRPASGPSSRGTR